MKKTKQAVSLLTIASLLTPALASAATAQSATASQQVASEAASKIALDQSTTALLSLIIASMKVESSAGKLVAVDPEIAKKYTYLRTAYLGLIPTSGVTSSAGYMGVESVKKVEFVLAPLTMLLRAIQTMGRISSENIEKFSVMTGLDKVITMTETKETRLIEIYNQYILDNDSTSSYSSTGEVKPSSRMGYISTVDDARKSLEEVFKKS